MNRVMTRTRTSCRPRLDRYHFPVATLEAFLAAIIAAQSAVDDPPPPEPREVAEAVGLMGLLSDPEERWFRPAVSARGGV